MALKILGQLVGTGAQVDLYAVPTARQSVVSSFIALNLSGAQVNVKVHAAKAGAANTAAQAIVDSDVPIRGRLAISEGWSLAATDVLRVTAPAGVSITLFGNEVAA